MIIICLLRSYGTPMKIIISLYEKLFIMVVSYDINHFNLKQKTRNKAQQIYTSYFDHNILILQKNKTRVKTIESKAKNNLEGAYSRQNFLIKEVFFVKDG